MRTKNLEEFRKEQELSNQFLSKVHTHIICDYDLITIAKLNKTKIQKSKVKYNKKRNIAFVNQKFQIT
jgi:hypothetical protein